MVMAPQNRFSTLPYIHRVDFHLERKITSVTQLTSVALYMASKKYLRGVEDDHKSFSFPFQEFYHVLFPSSLPPSLSSFLSGSSSHNHDLYSIACPNHQACSICHFS